MSIRTIRDREPRTTTSTFTHIAAGEAYTEAPWSLKLTQSRHWDGSVFAETERFYDAVVLLLFLSLTSTIIVVNVLTCSLVSNFFQHWLHLNPPHNWFYSVTAGVTAEVSSLKIFHFQVLSAFIFSIAFCFYARLFLCTSYEINQHHKLLLFLHTLSVQSRVREKLVDIESSADI